MKVSTFGREQSLRRAAPTFAASALIGCLAAIGGNAYAAAPPANTVIGNQASASYLDPNGNSQIATSNLVQTTVQQVGSFTLDTVNQTTATVINTKTGAAGATVLAPHVLTNTGNGSDSFNITVAGVSNNVSKVEVYADANFDGQPDGTTPLCSVTTPTTGTCTVPAQTVAGNNGQFGFVVAYTIPGTATTPTTPFDKATITATPATAALYTAPNTTAADVDQINLTTAAAFSASKALNTPTAGITAPGGGAWPTVVSTGPRSASGTCSTTWSAGLTSNASCQYTVYTVTYSNTGGASGRFAMQDTIGTGATSGMTYVAGSAVWSNAPGTAMGDGAGGDPAGTDFQYDGATKALTFVDNTLTVNTTRSVSFVVLVNNSAAVGTPTTNNQASYTTVDNAGATATAPGTLGVLTNFAPFTVTGTYSVVLGSTAQTAAGAGNTDTTAGTPLGTTAAGDDTTVVAGAASGTQVAYKVRVWNTGNATDNVDLSAATAGTAGGTALPFAPTYQWFAADGSTPLADTNGNGKYESGNIPAGGYVDVVVKVTIPGSQLAAAGPFSLTVTGSSMADTSKLDATRGVLSAITGPLVDLTNSAAGTTGASGDLGVGPSASPTTTNANVQAGTTTAFNLYVQNNADATNNAAGSVTYTLASSGSVSFPGSLPAGWAVKYAAAGTTQATCAAATAITTLNVANGAQGQYVACITVPVSATVGTQAVYFQVTGALTSGSTVLDTKYDAVAVIAPASTYSATLTQNNQGQVAPGGSVMYTHTLTNSGTGVCAAGVGETYTVTATLPAADVTAGWTLAVYQDGNGNGVFDDATTDPLVTGAIAGPLAAGASKAYFVKVFAPAGATAGATDTATVTASFTGNANSCGTPNNTDISTVITGQIRLDKTQALDDGCDGVADVGYAATPIAAAKPGACILYRVIATNQGTAQVKNVSVNDAIPTWTSTTGATQPATQCQSTGVGGTAPVYGATATSVSCGSAANTMQAGGTMQLDFAVKINPLSP